MLRIMIRYVIRIITHLLYKCNIEINFIKRSLQFYSNKCLLLFWYKNYEEIYL